MTTTRHTSTTLYVGDLSSDVSESTLFEVFNPIGPVSMARICRNRARESRGFGFVTFHTPADADRALQSLNFTPIKGKPMRLMWCDPNKELRKRGEGNIVVRNLHESIDDKTLWDAFSVFGRILSCKVVKTRDGKSKRYGYVHFEDPAIAKIALVKVSDMVLGGEKVTAEKFIPSEQRAAIRIKGLPTECTTEDVEAAMKEVGLESAVIASIKIIKSEKYGDFARVDFKEKDAISKVEATKLKIGGEEVSAELEASKDAMKRLDSQAFTNIFVQNIPLEVTAAELEKVFVGAILAHFADADASAESKLEQPSEVAVQEGRIRIWQKPKFGSAYACVDFTDPRAAKAAIALLNEKKFPKSGADEDDDEDEDGAGKDKRNLMFVSRHWPKWYLRLRRLSEGPRDNLPQANLYVKPLSPDTTKERLAALFSKFGEITSAAVKDGPAGIASRFGFVQFKRVEDAQSAMRGMRNEYDGKSGPLYVVVAQSKERRSKYRYRPRRGGYPRPQPSHFAPPIPGQFGSRMGASYPPTWPLPPFARPLPLSMPPMGYPPFRTAPAVSASMPRGAVTSTGTAHLAGAPRSYGRTAPASGPHPLHSATYAAGMSQSMEPSRSQPAGSVLTGSAAQRESMPALTHAALEAMNPAQRKRSLGERLFPKIQEVEPKLAGKITGMLLEIDNSELLTLLESPAALMKKINEALTVLKEHHMRTSARNSGKNSGGNPSRSVGAASSGGHATK